LASKQNGGSNPLYLLSGPNTAQRFCATLTRSTSRTQHSTLRTQHWWFQVHYNYPLSLSCSSANTHCILSVLCFVLTSRCVTRLSSLKDPRSRFDYPMGKRVTGVPQLSHRFFFGGASSVSDESLLRFLDFLFAAFSYLRTASIAPVMSSSVILDRPTIPFNQVVRLLVDRRLVLDFLDVSFLVIFQVGQ